jgi:hypothetical protein
MTDRTDIVETESGDETDHEERVYSPDGGVVASNPTPAASTPTEAGQQPTIDEDPSQETLEPRTKRARTEEMDVSLLQKGGLYEVYVSRFLEAEPERWVQASTADRSRNSEWERSSS